MMALLTVNCLVNCIKLDHAKLTNKQTLTTRITGLVLSYIFGVHSSHDIKSLDTRELLGYYIFNGAKYESS